MTLTNPERATGPRRSRSGLVTHFRSANISPLEPPHHQSGVLPTEAEAR